MAVADLYESFCWHCPPLLLILNAIQTNDLKRGQYKLPKIIQFQVSVDNNTMSRLRRSERAIVTFYNWKFATWSFSDSILSKLLTMIQ